MSVRLRRLQADYESVSRLFAEHPYIKLLETEGTPPERYRFGYQVYSLVPREKGVYILTRGHQAEVFLPLDYPRRPPFCRMLTEVFHPNIDPQKICIGDHWSAGQSLSQLVVRIGEMLCFQSYNVKSPLNAQAAVWVQEHLEQLPLEQIDISQGG